MTLMQQTPPPPRRTDFAEELHGVRVPDPYRWLEDTANPEVQAWLQAQADYAEDHLARLPARDTLRTELAGLFSAETIGVPVPRNGRYFFHKRLPGQDMGVYYVKDGLDGEPRPLIDPNLRFGDGSTTLKDCLPSRDGTRLLYRISFAGNDRAEIRVMDVGTATDLPDVIADDTYPYLVCWNADATGFWYGRRDPDAPSTQDEAKFHRRVFYHQLGTDVSSDTPVFGQGEAREVIPHVSPSQDGRYLLGELHGQTGGENWNELAIMDTQDAARGFVVFRPRTPGIECGASLHRDRIYVQTNEDAPRWKLASVSIADALTGSPSFADVIPAGEELLESFATVQDRIFATFLTDAHSAFREYALDGTLIRDIPLPTMGSVDSLRYEREGGELFFAFRSFAFPLATYRIDVQSGEVSMIEQMQAAYDTGLIETSQHWFVSEDGTRVPLFLIRRKDARQDGSNPALLYGYGGFDVSLTPSYLQHGIPFILRGGVYAIANLRGGGEFGKEWHEAGMKKSKQNVFDDFAAAARWLADEGYTSPDRLAVFGGSNGGLLTAVMAIQHPELVKAVVSSVPVTDMLRYHRYTGGRHWIPDYGDPEDADMMRYLLTYSPYHNATGARQYPAILITTASDDDRVHPMHSFKMAAAFQASNAGENPVIMRVEIKAGHGGASAVSKSVSMYADLWAFLFDELGVKA